MDHYFIWDQKMAVAYDLGHTEHKDQFNYHLSSLCFNLAKDVWVSALKVLLHVYICNAVILNVHTIYKKILTHNIWYLF